MGPAAQWVLLSSVLSLAFGVTLRDDKKEAEKIAEQMMFPSPSDCCEYEKTLLFLKKQEETSCKEFAHDASVQSKDVNCAVECALSRNGILNEDKTLNEKKFTDFAIKEAHPDARVVLEAAINLCFIARNGIPISMDYCGSGVDGLLGCIVSETVKNCPNTMWRKTKPQCEDSMELYEAKLLSSK